MAKKILKKYMEKQKDLKINKSNNPNKKKKYAPKYSNQDKNHLNSITKELLALSIHEDSQTQIGPIAKQKRSLSKKKIIKKSIEKQSKLIVDENLQAEYKHFLASLCPLHSVKYHKLNQKQTLINLEWFNKIKHVWKADKENKSHNIKELPSNGKQQFNKKTEKITYVLNITPELVKKLKPKRWLNDQIINSYIQLIQIDMLKKHELQLKKNELSIHMFQTYFAALKLTPQKVDREIKKRNLTSKSLIIIPINEDYHWFFLVIFLQKIFIFDSILPKALAQKNGLNLTKKVYAMKQSVRKCIKIYEKIFKVQQISLNNFILIKQFPQQDNQNDCGMMMLCGIKNVINKFLFCKRQQDIKQFTLKMEEIDFWNFCIQDIKFFRFLFVKEIMQEKLFIE